MASPERTGSRPAATRPGHSGTTFLGVVDRLSVALSTRTSTSRRSAARIAVTLLSRSFGGSGGAPGGERGVDLIEHPAVTIVVSLEERVAGRPEHRRPVEGLGPQPHDRPFVAGERAAEARQSDEADPEDRRGVDGEPSHQPWNRLDLLEPGLVRHESVELLEPHHPGLLQHVVTDRLSMIAAAMIVSDD